jgi:hypothetical protein
MINFLTRFGPSKFTLDVCSASTLWLFSVSNVFVIWISGFVAEFE